MTETSLLRAAEANGTPLYAYSLSAVARQYERLNQAIHGVRGRAFYAVKANAHPDILKCLQRLGAGAETVNAGEVRRALEAGFEPGDILFTCSNLGKEDFQEIARTGVKINVDSLNQLDWFGEMYPGGAVSLRINKDVGEGHHAHVVTGGALSKFGIHHTELAEARSFANLHAFEMECPAASGAEVTLSLFRLR